jgi:hypothetical protein
MSPSGLLGCHHAKFCDNSGASHTVGPFFRCVLFGSIVTLPAAVRWSLSSFFLFPVFTLAQPVRPPSCFLARCFCLSVPSPACSSICSPCLLFAFVHVLLSGSLCSRSLPIFRNLLSGRETLFMRVALCYYSSGRWAGVISQPRGVRR